MKQGLYDILQIMPGAAQEVVDVVYRRLCRMHHPDVSSDVEAEHRIRQITEAYAILGNLDKRKEYDRWLVGQRQLVRPGATGNEAAQEKERLYLEEGRQVLLRYFLCLQEQQLHKAYPILSRSDRERIPFRDYVEWQEAVGQMYHLGDLSVTPIRTHRLAGHVTGAEFLAEGQEFDLHADAVRPIRMVKSMTVEGGKWVLNLEYDDVRALATRFRLMAKSRHPRVIGLNELNLLAEHESYRSKRFHTPFSLAACSVHPVNGGETPGWLWEAKKLGWASQAMDLLRLTDVMAWTESGSCLLLLPHTDFRQAQVAARKMAASIETLAAEEGGAADVVWSVSQYNGTAIDDWVYGMERNLLRREEHRKTTGEASESIDV